MRVALFSFLLLAFLGLDAQYLIANRNSGLRQKPEAGYDQVIGGDFKTGDHFVLLDSGFQTNGYYKAQLKGTPIEGWVYRTLVKRMAGTMPTFMEAAISADVYIVDVGAGLGCIIKSPAGKFIIYDGGNSDYVNTFLNGLYDKGGEIALVIVSHTDADHWRSIDEIAEDYTIKQALFTSYRPGGLNQTIKKGIDALRREDGIKIHDLADHSIPADSILYKEQDFTIKFLSGFGKEDPVFANDIGSSSSKLRNAASIVVKLEYKDKSVLFTGDIKGMKDCSKSACDCEMMCISTEKYLLDLDAAGTVEVAADVIIAAHHGARNASCPDFIEAVSPEYVIFSAGNTHKHPHKLTANNFQSFGGVPVDNIFRTDVGKNPLDGDSNACNDEWIGQNESETESDVSFDDHIRVQITNEGKLFVGYLE